MTLGMEGLRINNIMNLTREAKCHIGIVLSVCPSVQPVVCHVHFAFAGAACVLWSTSLSLLQPGASVIYKHISFSVDKELTSAVMEVLDELGSIGIYTYSPGSGIPKSAPLDPILQKADSSPIDKSHRDGIKMTDTSVFIFTSGTTGEWHDI